MEVFKLESQYFSERTFFLFEDDENLKNFNPRKLHIFIFENHKIIGITDH